MTTIGVFDSGIGGKLVAKKIKEKFPDLSVIMKTDSEYFPYGNKSAGTISRRLVHFGRQFRQLKCRLVVVACNSATTSAIGALRKAFPTMSFIGIEPPIKPLVALTRSGKVAVMLTVATAGSKRLSDLIATYAGGVNVSVVACPGLAERVEQLRSMRRLMSDSVVGDLLTRYLDPPVRSGADVVGIACTHYSYLLPRLTLRYPRVRIYDPTEAVIAQVSRTVHSSRSGVFMV